VTDGNAPAGSPVYAATIGVADLDRSIAFYRDHIGFDLVDRQQMGGAAHERHWGLPPGATAEMAVLADRCEIGRIALVQWHAADRHLIRDVPHQKVFGFINLNFYSNDIVTHTQRIAAAGHAPWTEPLVHDMGWEIGEPVEVMIDGPDGVILNLIQFNAKNPKARTMETRAYVANEFGYNRCGLTPVVTTAHHVRDFDRAMAFYQRVFNMDVRIATVLKGEDMEAFTRFPPQAQARDTYLRGYHLFGKIALIQPLNFPCIDLVPQAVPPNIGYIAQSFLVPDLAKALKDAAATGSTSFTPPTEMTMPALGAVTSAIVRNPGSGGLQELIQRA
jgi:catechol 2,3-dioxygenase-like lactoylglutathione lyase family enzyme